MTNTLHRFGKPEDLRDDYVVFTMTTPGVNDKGAVQKACDFLRAARKYSPVNFAGEHSQGGKFRPEKNLNPFNLYIKGRKETVTVEQAYELARLTGLSMLGSLQRELGDLDRISGWGRLFGMVNSAPDFTEQPAVINGCSDLILEVFGPEIGRHARSAVGMASLPFGKGIAVEIEADVLID